MIRLDDMHSENVLLYGLDHQIIELELECLPMTDIHTCGNRAISDPLIFTVVFLGES